MRTSRRYQLRLPAPLESDLETFGSRHGLGLGPAIRLLVGRGLQSEAQSLGGAADTQDSPAALAALAAAEHAVSDGRLGPARGRAPHALAQPARCRSS